MRIYSRSEWGAAPPQSAMSVQSAPTEAFIHYSDDVGVGSIDTFAEQAQKARNIQDFHLHGRGWSDIAYHYLVFQPYGKLRRARVFAARGDRFVPAAQAGHNTGTLAICVVAGPGTQLKRNTRYQIEQLLRRYPSVETVGGHRDVVSTDCPGDVIYSWIPRIARASGKKVYKGGK